jgi:hypothetical protein
VLQDVQTFGGGGGAGEVSDCWRLRGAMVGFCSLEGKEEGVGCCAKLEKAPRSRISRLLGTP